MNKEAEKFLAGFAVEEARELSFAAAFVNSAEIADRLPSSKAIEVKHADSNTKTLEWQNGNAYWQSKRW